MTRVRWSRSSWTQHRVPNLFVELLLPVAVFLSNIVIVFSILLDPGPLEILDHIRLKKKNWELTYIQYAILKLLTKSDIPWHRNVYHNDMRGTLLLGKVNNYHIICLIYPYSSQSTVARGAKKLICWLRGGDRKNIRLNLHSSFPHESFCMRVIFFMCISFWPKEKMK